MKCRTVNTIAAMLIMILAFAVLWAVTEPAYGAAIRQNERGRSEVQYLGDSSDGKSWENPHHNGVSQYKYKVSINGKDVYGYCFQSGRSFRTGYTYTVKKPGNASAWTNLKQSRQRIIRLIMFYGYNNGKEAPYGNGNDYYAATQVLIWEAADGDLTLSENGKWKKSSNSHDDLIKGRSNAEKCYDWIRKQISEHVKGPSFAAKTAASARTYKMKYNYKKKNWSTVLDDTRAVNYYKRHGDTSDSLKVSRNGTSYTFSAAKAGTKTAVLSNSNSDGTSQPLMVMKPSDSGMQALLFGASDSTRFYAKFTTEKKGTATVIKKTSDGSSASGFRFLIKNKANGYSRLYTTDASGKIVLELYPGTYTVTEQLTEQQKAEGYTTPAGGKITVKEGGKSSLTLTNKRVIVQAEEPEESDPKDPDITVDPEKPEEFPARHQLTLTKTEILEDGTQTQNPVSGAVYEIYSIEEIGGEEVELFEGEYTTDAEGCFSVTGLSPGRYYIAETVTPDGYIRNDNPMEVVIKQGDEETQVMAANQREYGSVLIKKTNEEGYPLEDTVFGLYSDSTCETLISQYTTDDTGCVKISGLEWGTYYLREDKATRGYEGNDEVYAVVIGCDGVIEAEYSIINRQKKGSVELVKTDETGKLLLEGAVFDLYRNDGTLISAEHVTNETGRLKVEGLDWGDYYFQEVKAPEGYAVDQSPVRFSVNATTAGITQEVQKENKVRQSDICIKKKIRAADIHYDHGVPVFTFNLKGVTVDGEVREYNRQVTFSDEFVKSNTGNDGYVTASVIFNGLKAGTYTCSEWDTARYRLSEIAAISENGEVKDRDTVVFRLEGGDHGEATFINEKTDWCNYSDSTSLINMLKTEKRLTAILVEYVGPEVQEANKPFVPVDNLEVTAFYDDGSEKGLSYDEYSLKNADGTEFTKTEKQAGTYRVTVSYTEKGVTKKGDFSFVILQSAAVEEAYAIYCEENQSFTFIKSTEPIKEGDIYNGVTITAVYTGFEEETYSSYLDVPWKSIKSDIGIVIFADKICPVSTANWFKFASNCAYIDVSNLDMTRCITMDEMFYAMGEARESVTITGMKEWDTSNVQSMQKAFMRTASRCPDFRFDGIENWDTSSVTTVAEMFRNMGLSSTWTLDLSGWNVKNVTDYKDYDYGVTKKIIPPQWN